MGVQLKFKCDKCGLCCRALNRNPIFKDLDKGNGVCKYLRGNICSIYNDRPLICRVDDSYDAFFKDSMTKEEYYQLNYKVCNQLKQEELCI